METFGDERVQDVSTLKSEILEWHYQDICDMLFEPDMTQHYSIVIDIMALVDAGSDPSIWSDLAVSPHIVLPILDDILQDVQKDIILMNDNGTSQVQEGTQQQQRLNNNSNNGNRYGAGGFGRALSVPAGPGSRWTESSRSGSATPSSSEKRTPMYLKPKCSARVMGLPAAESRRRTVPTCADVGTFLSITATVIRTGVVKMLENKKPVLCTMCKRTFDVLADVEQYSQVILPTKCQATGNVRPCPGNRFEMIEPPPGQLPEGCRDYQEIKIQEQTNKLTMGTIPGSMVVILHDDLVDHAKSGDDVTITGTVIRRWKKPMVGERCDIELALLANHVYIHNEQRVGVGVTEEQRLDFEHFWEHARSKAVNRPYSARNQILRQICPKVYGLYIVKLAVMLVLTGGVQMKDKASGLRVRGEPHLLLVGDPGTGKSQFLKYAAELNPRSVLTTGIGSSSAGLTVTAVKDGHEWQLEAGALVLADRGLCCIDEFGGMREHDKVAIHEAMEQQSISIAKAGIVCKLNTRCSVIAATNPKGKYDPDQTVSINIALASPLLSRFDIVLVLMDTGNQRWDEKISSYILETRMLMDGGVLPKKKKELTPQQIRRRRRKLRKRSLRQRMEELGLQPGDDGYNTDVSESDGEDNATGEAGGGQQQHQQEDEVDEERARSNLWSIEKVKAYLIWIKSTFEPKLTPPAEEVLVSYYQLQRKADLRNAARTTIRLLESLIRLSQAHARLMARDLVTVQDAVVVISLIEATAQGGAAALGGINPLHASFPKSAEDEYWRQEASMLDRLGLSRLASRPQEVEDNDGGLAGGARQDDDEMVPGTDTEEIARAGVKRRRNDEQAVEDFDNRWNRYQTPPSPSASSRIPPLPGISNRNPDLGRSISGKSSSASSVSTAVLSTGSMVLDDRAEAEFLERLRQDEDGNSADKSNSYDNSVEMVRNGSHREERSVSVKVEEEEPLIDRRKTLRQTQQQQQQQQQQPPLVNRNDKGKGVVREREREQSGDDRSRGRLDQDFEDNDG
ncbi:DNA helicase mcm9 [Mortierella sp. AD032]|nr:DNA helicase mcm9 [Mortierella sp. AD032]